MLTQDPVRIPGIPGKIRFKAKNGIQYVQYLKRRRYDADKKHNIPEWANIGRRVETMPGLMYPNDNYEKYFTETGGEAMAETMTPEEESFIRKNKTYGKYKLFFDSLYFEFKQQTRKRPDDPLSRCKRECLNSVLRPLREMMKDEEYADLLRLIPDNADEELSCSDVMMILTQYRSALEKFHSSHK